MISSPLSAANLVNLGIHEPAPARGGLQDLPADLKGGMPFDAWVERALTPDTPRIAAGVVLPTETAQPPSSGSVAPSAERRAERGSDAAEIAAGNERLSGAKPTVQSVVSSASVASEPTSVTASSSGDPDDAADPGQQAIATRQTNPPPGAARPESRKRNGRSDATESTGVPIRELPAPQPADMTTGQGRATRRESGKTRRHSPMDAPSVDSEAVLPLAGPIATGVDAVEAVDKIAIPSQDPGPVNTQGREAAPSAPKDPASALPLDSRASAPASDAPQVRMVRPEDSENGSTNLPSALQELHPKPSESRGASIAEVAASPQPHTPAPARFHRGAADLRILPTAIASDGGGEGGPRDTRAVPSGNGTTAVDMGGAITVTPSSPGQFARDEGAKSVAAAGGVPPDVESKDSETSGSGAEAQTSPRARFQPGSTDMELRQTASEEISGAQRSGPLGSLPIGDAGTIARMAADGTGTTPPSTRSARDEQAKSVLVADVVSVASKNGVSDAGEFATQARSPIATAPPAADIIASPRPQAVLGTGLERGAADLRIPRIINEEVGGVEQAEDTRAVPSGNGTTAVDMGGAITATPSSPGHFARDEVAKSVTVSGGVSPDVESKDSETSGFGGETQTSPRVRFQPGSTDMELRQTASEEIGGAQRSGPPGPLPIGDAGTIARMAADGTGTTPPSTRSARDEQAKSVLVADVVSVASKNGVSDAGEFATEARSPIATAQPAADIIASPRPQAVLGTGLERGAADLRIPRIINEEVGGVEQAEDTRAVPSGNGRTAVDMGGAITATPSSPGHFARDEAAKSGAVAGAIPGEAGAEVAEARGSDTPAASATAERLLRRSDELQRTSSRGSRSPDPGVDRVPVEAGDFTGDSRARSPRLRPFGESPGDVWSHPEVLTRGGIISRTLGAETLIGPNSTRTEATEPEPEPRMTPTGDELPPRVGPAGETNPAPAKQGPAAVPDIGLLPSGQESAVGSKLSQGEMSEGVLRTETTQAAPPGAAAPGPVSDPLATLERVEVLPSPTVPAAPVEAAIEGHDLQAVPESPAVPRQNEPAPMKSRSEVPADGTSKIEPAQRRPSEGRSHRDGSLHVRAGQTEAMARYLESRPYLRPILEAVSSQRQDGTRGADADDGMRNVRSTGRSAAPSLQKLPAGKSGLSAVSGKPVPASGDRGSVSEEVDGDEATGTHAILKDGTVGDFATADSRAVEKIDASTDRVQRLETLMARDVNLFRRSGAQSLSVVLRPDPGTEVLVHFHQRDGQVEAMVRCERGDFTDLGIHWNQLRDALAAHQVRLVPAGESSSASVSVSSMPDGSIPSGARSGMPGERHAPQRHETGEAGVPLRERSGVSLETVRGGGPPEGPRTGVVGERWETWA